MVMPPPRHGTGSRCRGAVRVGSMEVVVEATRGGGGGVVVLGMLCVTGVVVQWWGQGRGGFFLGGRGSILIW